MVTSFRRLLPLLALALLGLGAMPAVAAPARQATAVAISARPAYDGAFRPGTWLPVIVDLENSGPDRRVELRVGTREGAQYATRLDLPNGGRKSVTLYVYLTPASRRLTARLMSDGEELAQQPITLQPANPNARLVGVIVPDGSVLRLPARLNPTTPLVAIPMTLADIPEQALGLSGLHALLLEEVPTADLSDRQRAALHEWVIRGGQLIVGGGTEGQRTLEGLPAELRPVDLAGQEALPPESLFGPGAAGLVPVPYTSFTPRTPEGNRPPYPVTLSALAGQSQPAMELTLGRGAVLALAFPLGHPALVAWEGAPALWSELLRGRNELPAGFAPENTTFDGFTEGNLAASLTSLPALDFPPLGLIAGLVVAYIVLVGPVTYVVLRRLDRQHLGWVVVPAITMLFAGLTYGIGFVQRGGDVVMNQVTLIEPVEGAEELARVRSFVGIFSPERRNYSLAAASQSDSAPLLRPISVQGPWDVNANGASGLFLQDVSPGAAAERFEITQWSMRALSADSIVAFGDVDARLLVDGDKLTAEVHNRSAVALQEVTLIQGDRVARLGTIAPGATAGGELVRRQGAQPGAFGPTPPVSYLVFGEEMDNQGKQGGQPLPMAVQQRIRVLDALYNYGPSLRGGQPLLVAWADLTGLELSATDVRADEQHSALVTFAPRVALGQSEVTLASGWLAPRFEGGQTNACFGGQGTGVTLGAAPAVFQLTLPRDLAGFSPSALTLLTASDGPWLDSTTLELYDWSTGNWEPIAVTQRELDLNEPARFLGGGGALRVRLSSPQPQGNFGCLYVDARLKGVMP